MQKKIYKARYSEISDILVSQITSGHYELGQQLPSEQAMSESFNVSRFTIRAALREIEKMGMISRHRRRGTILLSDKPVELIVQEIKGFEELFQYPQDTVLHMTKSSSMEADISLANFLKTTPGTDWTRLEGIRVTQDKTPFCVTDIYVPKEINLSLKDVNKPDRPVFKIIEENFGLKADEINAEIMAGSLGKDRALRLNVEAGSSSIIIVRRYRDTSGRLFEVSVSEHPASRFTYSFNMSYRR